MKCFNCKCKGHLAADCPDPPKKKKPEAARMIESSALPKTSIPQDPWILTVSARVEDVVEGKETLPR